MHKRWDIGKLRKFNYLEILLGLIPIGLALWVWCSSLAFVPVPWPDDSAFYFVAKDLFQWPPRWVMLSQAPFEPTYRIFNFNTMPLYPILIGVGRWIGIDGSHLLKIWPLGAWALSGSLLSVMLYRGGLPFFGSLLVALAFSLDPTLRWASDLLRPESLIGLFGVYLVLGLSGLSGLSLGFPKKIQPRSLWDPVAFLLALAAYCHFNSIHLLWPVVFAFFNQPRRLFEIGTRTLLYLSPWLLTVVWHWRIFLTQMSVQWGRLNLRNEWISTPSKAIESLFPTMGSPEPWPIILSWTSVGIWALFGLAMVCIISHLLHSKAKKAQDISLFPAAGWVLGAAWIFHTKPELWFIYYFHIAIWCFAGLLLLKLWKSTLSHDRALKLACLILPWIGTVFIFSYVDIRQAFRLGATSSWNWPTYYRFVDCVDEELTQLEKSLSVPSPQNPQKFQVWCPTFPDITVELSIRHPHWELTRTNDFWSRNHLAIQHAWDTQAVVVTETLNWPERTLHDKAENAPGVQSTWMLWDYYYLNQLWKVPGWKPNRSICQEGRWQAFLFMNDPSKR